VNCELSEERLQCCSSALGQLLPSRLQDLTSLTTLGQLEHVF